MKSRIIIVFFLLAASNSFAQFDTLQYGKLIFYRDPAYYGAAFSTPIYLNEQLVIRLKNGRYYEYLAIPGSYIMSDSKKTPYKLPLEIEKGKTYYIKLFIMPGIWRAYTQYSLVDPSQAQKELGALPKQGDNLTTPGVPEEQKPLLYSLGVIFSFGSGLNPIKMGETDQGDDIEITMGSSLIVGGVYNYAISKSFEMDFAATYSASYNTPTVKNYESVFQHFDLEMTYKYVYKLSDYYSLSFGAGPQVSLFPRFSEKIENNPEAVITYKNTFGGKTTFDLIFNASDNLVLFTGLRAQFRKYKLKEATVGGLPAYVNIYSLNNPTANAILMNFGVLYRF